MLVECWAKNSPVQVQTSPIESENEVNFHITGTAGPDQFHGGRGGDYIGGGKGDDHFSDGAGADILEGGEGNDVIELDPDSASDTIVLGEGDNTVVTSVGGDNLDDRLVLRISEFAPDLAGDNPSFETMGLPLLGGFGTFGSFESTYFLGRVDEFDQA